MRASSVALSTFAGDGGKEGSTHNVALFRWNGELQRSASRLDAKRRAATPKS